MAYDAFLKLDGIDGESTDSVHKDEIEILSFSWGMSNAVSIGGSTGGAGAGKASFQDLTITKLFDKTSPVLMINGAEGKVISSALLSVRKAGGEATGQVSADYLKITLSDVFVSSFNSAGAEGSQDDRPTDEVSLAFVKIDVWYQAPTGEIAEDAWDISANQGS